MSSDKGGTGFEPVPMGTHIAICVTVVDLGVQQTPWGSKEKVYLGFEVPGVRVQWTKDEVEHEGPALVGSTYTNSLHPDSNLGQALVSWRGRAFTDDEKKGFDLFNILGVACMVSVTHNKKDNRTYANIASIMGVPKGTEIPKVEGELIGYTATDPAYSGTLEKLPEWLKNKALDGQRQSPKDPEFRTEGVVGYDSRDDEFDDDIPFN